VAGGVAVWSFVGLGGKDSVPFLVTGWPFGCDTGNLLLSFLLLLLIFSRRVSAFAGAVWTPGIVCDSPVFVLFRFSL
jgi:hypothetical protein